MPRKKKKAEMVGGRKVQIRKRVPCEDGSELRGRTATVVGDPYKSDQAGGEEYSIVQLDETGGVVGVPTKALGGTRKGVSLSGLFSAERWDKLFGRRR